MFKRQKNKTIKNSDVKKQYRSEPSFSDLLPWLEWSDEHDVMLLEDRQSVGAVLELQDIACEATSQERIEMIHQKMTNLLSSILPLHEDNPWVLQFFIQDELTLEPLYKRLENYIAERQSLDDPFVHQYLSIQRKHFKTLCREEGMFKDPMNDLAFRGRIRRIRVVIYRRCHSPKKVLSHDVIAELKSAVDGVMSRLKQGGIKVRRLRGEHIYDWWVRWFNPAPSITDGDQDKLLEKFPYPKKEKPYGWSFSQNIFFRDVDTDDAENNESWLFDNVKHRLLMFQDLQSPIDIGVMSRERGFGNGNEKYALLDKLPPGSIYTIQIIFESKKLVKDHLAILEKSAVGKGQVIDDVLNNISRARYEIDEKNNMLFRSVEGIYIRESKNKNLDTIEREVSDLLMDSNLLIYRNDEELFPLDTYLRLLPFNFNYYFDRDESYRSTYKYADDIARLLPIYGRSRGDGINPLFIYSNRAGEPFIFDHLNKSFKMSNSHMAIIGTTGAGKSVTLNNLCMSLSAVYNPHIISLEVGGSFELTSKYLKKHGRKVGVMKFDRKSPFTVNPYAEAYKALALIEEEEAILKNEASKTNTAVFDQGIEEEVIDRHANKIKNEISTRTELATEKELECEEDRDILNEIVLATRMMITRGEEEEEKKLDLTDMTLISRGLVAAMRSCKSSGVKQMRVQHVMETFDRLASEEKNERLGERYKIFAMRLEYYTTDIRGKFINHTSEPLDDHDYLQIDFGFMQDASYKDLMNIICISMLAKILALADRNKATGRPTILIIDEAHVFFKSEMIATFIILMAKVARKIGLCLIPCTQNINDFRGVESRKVLSMMETWLCLALDREEVALLEQFKTLTDEMRDLVLDIRKYQGVYSEGVLLGKRFQGLFRNVPPRISLSLAMTEQDERTKRKKLQIEKGLTELEAVEHIATEMETVNTSVDEDKGFL